MIYRRSVQVAIQAAILLALEPEGTSRRVRELADALEVPATYLTKVLQGLTRAGLLRAVRGPGGGVHLARPAREIGLWEVVAALEPVGEFHRCFLGLGQCDDSNPCAFHENWAPVRARIWEMLRAQSLWELAAGARERGLVAQVAGSSRPIARLQKKPNGESPAGLEEQTP